MLKGIELINCAKANAKQGKAVAAKLSGYDNVDLFIENLNQACREIGIEIDEFDDLITDQQIAKENRRVLEVSPDSNKDL